MYEKSSTRLFKNTILRDIIERKNIETMKQCYLLAIIICSVIFIGISADFLNNIGMWV